MIKKLKNNKTEQMCCKRSHIGRKNLALEVTNIFVNTVTIVLIFCLVSTTSLALGIVPSHEDVNFESGQEKTMKIKIIKEVDAEYDVLLYAQGPLENNIFFKENVVELKKGEDGRIIEYTLSMPESVDKQGVLETSIIAKQVPKKGDGRTVITAGVSVVSKLRLVIPYSGKYSEVRLVVPIFKQNEETNFAVEVKNLGTEDIISAQAIIDIYGPLNNKLATVKSGSQTIRTKDKAIIDVAWKATLPSGTYKAKLTVVYDERNAIDEEDFNIGVRDLRIDDISVNNFKLGGIAKFEILVSNEWNLPVDGLYADFQVMNKENTIYTQSRTAQTSIPSFGKGTLEAFWNTELVTPDRYKLKIILHGLDLQTEKMFDILVENNKITTSLTGEVILGSGETDNDKGDSGIEKTVYILVGVVLMLVLFNGYIYFRKIRKPPANDKSQ